MGQAAAVRKNSYGLSFLGTTNIVVEDTQRSRAADAQRRQTSRRNTRPTTPEVVKPDRTPAVEWHLRH